MSLVIRPFSLSLGCLFLLSCFVSVSRAQSISFNYRYNFEPTVISAPPQLSSLDVDFPEAARKNGVEGTVKLNFTLGEDGKVREILIVKDLPFGVGDAVKHGLEKLYFKPAEFKGQPVPMKVRLDYIVAMAYSEDDKNVTRPQFTEKPEPVYPENQRSAKVKGKVLVTVMFYSDGTLKVVGTNSVMPREFDKAAAEAAGKIKFSPAVHKKSKKPVTQQVSIEYEFKP